MYYKIFGHFRVLVAGSVLAALALLSSALSVNPAGAESPTGEEPTLDASLLQDDPDSSEGIPDDIGNDFEGLTVTEDSDASSKVGVSAISPNYDPSAASRGNEPERVSSAAALPAQPFPEGEVLGDIAAIRASLEQAQIEDGDETVRVLITIRPPAGADSNDMGARIARMPEIEQALASTGSVVLNANTHIPVMTVLISEEGLESVLAVDATGGIELDFGVEALLDSATPVTGADITHAQQSRGGSSDSSLAWEVAILDNGVRTTHDAFGSRLADEACYTTDASCPNGLNVDVSPGSGQPNGGGHGTHVAGIASGDDVGFGDGGVAREAGLIAVNVFDASQLAYNSSIIGGMNFVIARETGGAKVVGMNLSLGTTTVYTSACDSFSPAMVTAIAAARSEGMLVVFAAGNSSSTTGVSFPSCITGSTTIANSTDSDLAAASTNINATLAHLWAPGSSITAPWWNSDTSYATLTGTSMAAPHVLGAAAVLADCFSWVDPTVGSYANMDDDILALMVNNGVSVTDNRAGGTVTLPRLDLLAAAEAMNNNNFFATPETLSDGAVDADYNHCATEEVDEPGSGVASIWYDYTASADGFARFSTCDADTTADTIIGVYTGSALNALSQIVENDDDGNCSESTLHSTATVAVQAGVTYKVRVSVYEFGGYRNGRFDISTEYIVAPTCDGLTATIIGTPGPDLIVGTAGDDVIVAGNGPDNVDGLGGNDTICLGNGWDIGYGAAGEDTIFGGNGNDQIYGEGGVDFLVGGDGADKLWGGDDDDSMFGNAGNDVLRGGAGDDYMSANAGEDRVYGEGDNDTMFGGNDHDRIWGGDGNDLLYGNFGDDDLYGEAGFDLLSGKDGFDLLNGGSDGDQLYGGSDPDTLIGGPGDDFISGNAGNDSIEAGSGNDTAFGGSGDDLMLGGTGNDSINGNTGDDDLRGNADNDTLNGGAGTDSCNGGSGSDSASGSCEVLSNIP